VAEREAFVDQTNDFILKEDFASYQLTTKLWLILFCFFTDQFDVHHDLCLGGACFGSPPGHRLF
jgi:hypothetical protein